MSDSAYSRFLDVHDSEIFDPQATARILPIPYDLTTSYRAGARFGPVAILEASVQVERFHDELEWDASQYVRFQVEPEVPPVASGPKDMMDSIYQRANMLLQSGDFLLSLGGEHSISAPLIQAHLEKYPNLHVVQIDAHGDLRDTWNGTPHSHACVMRRVVDMGVPLTQVGIRNISEEEHLFLNSASSASIHTWKGEQLQNRQEWDRLLQHLQAEIQGPVYLSIDVDGIDPSVIPATGTPEPGGLSWYQTLDVIRTLAKSQNVVGADVMELSPMPGLQYAEFACAKLCYQVLSHVFYHRLNC